MRCVLPGLALLLWLLAVGDAVAAPPAVDGFHPPCGTPGDLVYVQGKGLGPATAVSFQGRAAEVVRAGAEVLLCRVPEGLGEGHARIEVGGSRLDERFVVLGKGRPVIHGTTATVATPGQTILLHGRRLAGGHADFLDAHDVVAGSTDVVGGRRAVAIRVPPDLEPGRYWLRVTNERGLASPPSSPTIHVCTSGPRLVFTVRGGTVRPGQRVTYKGMNLGPLGSCEVRWARCDEGLCATPGWSNGYDTITVVVPYALRVDEWHQVKFAACGEDPRAVTRVFALPATQPRELTLDADTVEPGGTVGLQGMPTSGLGGWPTVHLARGDLRARARTLYLHPGGLGHGRSWVVRVPDTLPEGDYRVSVAVGDHVTDAGAVHVSPRLLPAAAGATSTD